MAKKQEVVSAVHIKTTIIEPVKVDRLEVVESSHTKNFPVHTTTSSKIVIYDPNPPSNDYLSLTWFKSIFDYGKDQGRDISFCKNHIHAIKNSNVLIDVGRCASSYPVKDNHVISVLKNNGNKVFCFDINDHSSLGFYGFDLKEVDFIFKVSGIQENNTSNELLMDNDLTYRMEPKYFLNPSSIDFENYKRYKDENRFMSLPYVMDDNSSADAHIRPYEERMKKCLVRGGAHFKRVHLFFNLLKKNLADENSAFDVKAYSNQSCSECSRTVRQGNYTYQKYKNTQHSNCNNPAIKWREPLCENFFNANRWGWNNRCYPMYYWLMDKFIEKYGHIDPMVVEQVFNNNRLGLNDLNEVLGKYMFYGDFKWIFSIYMPQRFWQAAQCKNINLLAERAADQSYFPVMKKDDHFLTFKEDFSDLEKLYEIKKDQYQHITNNCYDLYHRYIRWGNYKVSTNLMDQIFNKIEII